DGGHGRYQEQDPPGRPDGQGSLRAAGRGTEADPDGQRFAARSPREPRQGPRLPQGRRRLRRRPDRQLHRPQDDRGHQVRAHAAPDRVRDVLLGLRRRQSETMEGPLAGPSAFVRSGSRFHSPSVHQRAYSTLRLTTITGASYSTIRFTTIWLNETCPPTASARHFQLSPTRHDAACWRAWPRARPRSPNSPSPTTCALPRSRSTAGCWRRPVWYRAAGRRSGGRCGWRRSRSGTSTRSSTTTGASTRRAWTGWRTTWQRCRRGTPMASVTSLEGPRRRGKASDHAWRQDHPIGALPGAEDAEAAA